MGVQYRYKFGSAVFDESRFELLVDGTPVDIQRKPLQVLNVLLQAEGRAVPRDEFIRSVWRGQPTVDNVLANAIVKLRSALGPEHEGAIENIPRMGYRFTEAFDRVAIASASATHLNLQAGTVVPRRDHFKLQRLLGASAANEVWLARHAKTGEGRVFKFATGEQYLPGLKREVTLSRLLRNGLGERPDFVRVIDWNFDVSPYFIESEYGGPNLADWAREDDRLLKLERADRIDLFVQIAQAVSTAHSLAVLHKDLKPSNVLVSAAGESWQCRLVDFGSGRLLDLARLGELGITPMGLTITAGIDSDAARGTLLYAAPELLGDEPATVRSDIYALGVLLYQMVVADLQRGMEVGWERDVDDELLRADIARATDREPARRFSSVSEFVDQLSGLGRRHKEVAAAAEQAERLMEQQRRLEKLQSRRPWLYGVIGVLTAGMAISTTLYVELRMAREQTAQQLASATALNTFLTEDLISAANPAVTGRKEVGFAEAVETAASKVDQTLASATPEARAAVHFALQSAFFNLSNFKAAATEGQRAVAEWTRSAVPDKESRERARLGSAYALTALGRHDEADRLFAEVERELPNLRPPSPEMRARLLFHRGHSLGTRMQLGAAKAEMTKAWELARQPSFSDLDLSDVIAMSLSDINTLTGDYAQAESLARELLAKQEKKYGVRHARPCFTQVALANALGYQKHFQKAVELAQGAAHCLSETLGAMNQRTLDAQRVAASMWLAWGRFQEAADAFGAVAALFEANEGETSSNALASRTGEGEALLHLGQAAEAEQRLHANLERGRKFLPEDNPMMQALRYLLAQCSLDLGKVRGTAELLKGLSPEALNAADIQPDWEARLALQRGRLALLSGQHAQAKALLTQARQLQTANPGGQEAVETIDKLLAMVRKTGL